MSRWPRSSRRLWWTRCAPSKNRRTSARCCPAASLRPRRPNLSIAIDSRWTMRRNFEMALARLRDPRVAVRVLLGALLLANLAMAVLAFRPFGGGADDLRAQQASLDTELAAAKNRLAQTRQIVAKVQTARAQGDEFVAKYINDQGTAASAMLYELNRMAEESHIRQLPVNYNPSAIEGSDNFRMVTVTDGCEGSYHDLATEIAR